MMPGAGTRTGRVKKLARAGMWVAVGAEVTLVSVSPGWTLVALACWARSASSPPSASCPPTAAGGAVGGRAAASAGAAAMPMTGLPGRQRTGGTCWS